MKPLSKKRLKEIAAIKDEDIDYSDIPELGPEFWNNCVLVYPSKKKPISLRIDQEVYDWYKRRSDGEGYQSLMNAVLRTYMLNAPKEKR